jgi:hypothetical protein
MTTTTPASSYERTPITQLFEDLAKTKCPNSTFHKSNLTYICLSPHSKRGLICEECLQEIITAEKNLEIIDLETASRIFGNHNSNLSSYSKVSKKSLKKIAGDFLDFLAAELAAYIKTNLKKNLFSKHGDLLNVIFEVPQKTEVDSIYQLACEMSGTNFSPITQKSKKNSKNLKSTQKL